MLLNDSQTLGNCGFTNQTARPQAPAMVGLAFRLSGEVFIFCSDLIFNGFQISAFLTRSADVCFPPSRRFVRAVEDRVLLHSPGASRRHEAPGFWQHSQRAGGPVTDGVQETRTTAGALGEEGG